MHVQLSCVIEMVEDNFRGHAGCARREPKAHWSHSKRGLTKSDQLSVFGWLTV